MTESIPGSTAAHRPTVDSVLAALAGERRRHVVRHLRSSTAPVSLADLARDVAASEADSNPIDVDPDEVQRVYLSLYHSHVPKLVDTGLVSYSDDHSTVRLTDDAGELVASLPYDLATIDE